ncbi:dihydroxyacetone kinase family protein [Rhodococcus sp. BP-252]|uniref:dihydroxyacetone kinase family protein n=1 Tax=unclassified Rhodococcus (in: high G+C Gram-positive bacteria) TaxID=192944 RepID=UPI0014301764|nr:MULTISPECIES: dihydroxyacetone kinase family protein [unclassified Rhodococcus (in: high G+C Gram-positive bacteria)]NIL75957.1 D-erythrulose kinase [Rhodococcus sp. B10]MBY6413979.1 dihydroxyacetone kinase family protein [Rhodococcus sp. BP-320]MBY6418788.1 dihydroxyacetone kinase family protein [Rhodococcus sp. BP-321]MBY6423331.1 dihydroxyacetone kinase family protein [Rhodococcus sp. BP-324]MBY6428823.1 dihydroxyacetone kinase family protein [Rhodococcus sp. BP-323]
MTKLFNDPSSFMEDMLDGFLDANARYVVGVPGGVVRATETPQGKAAVVVGGGSGHYPAFCGVVGRGFADGAVVGNIFTSPSADDAASVARAADNGGGVLLTTGNYAGDVMNFGLAVQKLRSEGIDARYLAVTDDIASAPKDQIAKRRGIAGDFTVFRCASAAADSGYDMNGVERVGIAANDATRTLGVAFDGCTMPGAADPLFTVAQGTMDLGLGIHGEPGVSSHAMPTASELAELLVDGVLAEKPAGSGDRIAVILNGLGRTKYEELFVVWSGAAARLRDAGYTIVDPEVGELVTSLDMAGCSLTVMWLDDELERLWTSPADTPAYRKGIVDADAGQRRSSDAVAAVDADTLPESDESSRDCGTFVAASLKALAERMADAEDELGRIDAVAGDGDHGRGMVKGTAAGSKAADEAVSRRGGAGSVLAAAGSAWAAKAGGTSGVLWGAALTAIGNRLGNKGTPDDRAVAEALRAGYDALTSLGGAALGDKTMLDAFDPFVGAIEKSVAGGNEWRTAWTDAVVVARTAADDTAELRPRVGRARPLAEKSVGTPDAGAISLAMCVATVAELFTTRGLRS